MSTEQNKVVGSDARTVQLEAQGRERANAARPLTQVRDAIATRYPELFGDHEVNGRVVNVQKLIADFVQQFGRQFVEVLGAKRAFRELVAAGRARHGFADPDQVIEDADGNRLTVAQIRQGLLDNFRGVDSPVRWQLNERVAIPEETMRPGLQGTGPVADLTMGMGAINAGAYGATSWMWDWEDAGGPHEDKQYAAWRNLKQLLAGEWDDKRLVRTFPDGTQREYGINVKRGSWPVIFHRVPGMHLKNGEITVEGNPIPAVIPALIFHAVHNYDSQKEHGSGIYYYVPKLDTPEEALVVAKLLKALEEAIGVPRGTLKIELLNERGGLRQTKNSSCGW